MADEATCIETPTEFRRYTVADGTAIPLGTLLQLTDANTASAHSGDGQVFAGIAWEEKTANDGITEITAAVNGIWDLTDGGVGFGVGSLVALDGTANEVRIALEAEVVTGDVIGKALETAAGNEVVRVAVGRLV